MNVDVPQIFVRAYEQQESIAWVQVQTQTNSVKSYESRLPPRIRCMVPLHQCVGEWLIIGCTLPSRRTNIHILADAMLCMCLGLLVSVRSANFARVFAHRGGSSMHFNQGDAAGVYVSMLVNTRSELIIRTVLIVLIST